MQSKPAINSTASTSKTATSSVCDDHSTCDNSQPRNKTAPFNTNKEPTVLYHQPDKMVKSKEDLEARRESLAQLKKQHGID